MKKVIKGITYNTENAIKHFVINKETETELIHKEFYQKKNRFGQKKMFFVYIDKWNGCGPDSVRISEEIKALTYKEALELFEEKYGDRCNNNNTYNYIKELYEKESYMKNYKFTGATKVVYGITLKQIECEKYGVGGWIESESNLSQRGDCWVYGDAIVFGNAKVYDNAVVLGNAVVYGKAKVYDYAKVYGNAQLCDNVKVYGNAQVYGDAEVNCDAKVYGNAKLYETCLVYGKAKVYDYAKVYGNAQVYGNAKLYNRADVSGDAEVYGKAEVYGFAKIYGKANVCY